MNAFAASRARRRGAASRTVLGGGALVAVLGAAMLLAWWKTPPTKPATDVGRSAVEQFLTHIREGRPGEAWDSATAEFKSIEGRESFIKSAGQAPLLREPLQFVSVQEVQVGEEPRAEYVFQSPDSKIVRALVGYEVGVWKVDRLSL